MINIEPPHLLFVPRCTKCRSSIIWDQESLVMLVTLTNPDKDTTNPDDRLTEIIDQDFSIEQGNYRLVLGEMDILLDSHKNIKSLEIRTNPLTWKQSSLSNIPSNIEDSCIDFDVEYDANQIAYYDSDIRIIRDSSRSELSIKFGKFSTSRWAVIADGLIVGVTLDCYLCEFRLVDFPDLF